MQLTPRHMMWTTSVIHHYLLFKMKESLLTFKKMKAATVFNFSEPHSEPL